MAAIFPEMFGRIPMVGSGCGLLLIGALVWNLPRIFKGTLAVRRDYAVRLRAAGEIERAARVERETAMIVRRVPMYGRVFVAVGVVAMLAGLFISR